MSDVKSFLCIVLSAAALLAVSVCVASSATSDDTQNSTAEPNTPSPGMILPHKTVESPTIDGILDEQFWNEAPIVKGFTTFIPDFDIVPKEQTEVKVAYDAENLYFAFRCYDDVDKIKASVSAHDKMLSDDFICINLDAFNDHQALTAFYVNPLGIQGDSKFAAGNEDFSPDYVWYSAGKIDSAGYTVEVQIPLKSLRYNDNDPTTMGMIFERYISRRSEHSTFPRLDPAKGFALLTQMYSISYTGIEHYKLLELLPTITATRQDVRKQNTLDKDKQEADASLTMKYGLTSDLILDGTVNPDFSQVESDAGQVDVNLRTSIRYSEKRPFFLEGKDNFNLAASNGMVDPTIFYSRTIADPLIGTRLTGKIGTQNTVAALYAVDNVLEADRPTLGRYTRVPVLRFKRSLDNDSYVGFLYAGQELEQSSNRVAGFDEQYRLSESKIIESSGFLSFAKDNLTGSNVLGNTLGMRFAHSSRDYDYSFGFREVSDNFRADMGYVARNGLVNMDVYYNPRIFPQSETIQKVGFEFLSTQTLDRFSGLWETREDAATNIFFSGNWLFRVRGGYSTEIYYNKEFQTSGIHVQLRGEPIKTITFSTTYHRERAIYYSTPEQGMSNTWQTSFIVQPSENLRTEGTFTYTNFFSDATDAKLYDAAISRLKATYQVNQYLFFRAIGEYNNFRQSFSTEFLTSFTYIPGTAVYLGYGSVLKRIHWDGTDYVPGDRLIEQQRGLFLKMSYLWRA